MVSLDNSVRVTLLQKKDYVTITLVSMVEAVSTKNMGDTDVSALQTIWASIVNPVCIIKYRFSINWTLFLSKKYTEFA